MPNSCSDKSKACPCVEIFVEEMKAFIGLLIVMRIVTSLVGYILAKRNHLIFTSGTDVSSEIKFQLADSSQQIPRGEPGHDKLGKLLDILTKWFQSNCNTVTITESMIPFKGLLGFKQYMKDKPAKYG